MDKLVIKVHDSKIYKSYENVRAVFDKLKIHMPGPMSEELENALNELETEAELISYNHATFYGLCKQYTKKMEEVGLESSGLPRDDNDKIVVFKSQAKVLDTLLGLISALGKYYDK